MCPSANHAARDTESDYISNGHKFLLRDTRRAPMSTLLAQLAERVCAIRLADAPRPALDTAKEAVLDTVGVTLAGADAEATCPVLKTVLPLANAGPALIFGSGSRVDVLSAALVNGTASHALDFDDCSITRGGHPSAPIVPALWSLAEARGSTGGDFLAAYVAGVECETKLGRAVNFHHYEKGWHPTATLGTFGSAAACSRLIGLDPHRMTHALALAVSMASGVKANFGTMTKPFHVGHAARNGLFAALLAENGMTANVAALEDPQGFLAVFNGEGTYATERLLENWGAPLDLVEPGIAFKRHPCCASTHPALYALLLLRSDHGLTPANVATIESWTHPRRFRHTNRPVPQSGLDGKFSVQYCLARALAQGFVGLDDFSDEAVRDTKICGLLGRVRSLADPDARVDTAEHFYARVRVTTVDGKVVEAFVDRPLGRDRDHPLPLGTLDTKFRDCAGQVLDKEAVAELLDGLRTLECVERIADLSDVIARRRLSRAA